MTGWSGLRELFRSAGYRRLLATRIFAQLGDGAFQVGLAGLFFFSPQRETTPVGVAWALTASLLPYTVIGPFAGVLLDRWYRRNVLVVANLIRASIVVVAGTLAYTGTVNGWLLLVVLICLSVDRFVLAGLGASLPHVVAAENLVLANAITPTLGTVASVCGGAASFGLAQWLGGDDTAGAIGMSLVVVLYLGSGWAVSRLAVPALGPDGGPRRAPILAQLQDLAVGMGHGARHVWRRPVARWSMALTAGIRVPFGAFAILAILLSRNTFSASVPEGMRLVATAAGLAGLGAGLAAVLVPIGVRLLGLKVWTVCCLVVIAGVCVVFGVAMSRGVLLAGALPLGLAVQGAKVGVDTTLQLAVDDEYLGRAFSLYDMVFNASFVVAALLAVAVVPASGLSMPLWLGLGVLVVTVTVGQLQQVYPARVRTDPTTPGAA